jgi:hypothetical protein
MLLWIPAFAGMTWRPARGSPLGIRLLDDAQKSARLLDALKQRVVDSARPRCSEGGKGLVAGDATGGEAALFGDFASFGL